MKKDTTTHMPRDIKSSEGSVFLMKMATAMAAMRSTKPVIITMSNAE
jgi:hypothetical protein